MISRIATFTCLLAMLTSICPATFAGFKDTEPGNTKMRATNHAEAPLLPHQAEEPLLTTIAQKITASPDFSGTVIPGQLLNVKLVLPPELGGSAAITRRGVATRPPRRGVTRIPRGEIRRPGGVRVPIRDVTAAVPTNDIPCQSFPGGCPPPITLGPGIQLSNFTLHVKWSVLEFINGTRTPLLENQDFQSPSSEGLSRAFVLAPLRVVEYTGGAAPANPNVIVATVSITADKIVAVPPSTTQVTSSEVPVEVPLSLSALAVPKVFVLFLDKNFGGAAAIYLPRNTLFQGPSAQVQEQLFSGASQLLNTYNTVASRLNFVTWFASYLAGLEALRKVRDVPHVDVKERKDSESNLNDDDFIHRSPFTSLNDTEVEDESSALLLLGPPRTQVRFFQDRSFRGGEFVVQTSNPRDQRIKPPGNYAPGVLVSNFDAVTTSVPPGNVTVVKKFTITIPGGAFGSPPPRIQEVTPNDRLSSFRWRL